MAVAGYLIDTSALARVLLRQNTAEWDDRIAAGLVSICDVTEPEDLHSARSATDRTCLKAALDAHYPWCPMPEASTAAPASPRNSRPPRENTAARAPVDLLVAATAEEAGLPLPHDDRDFETITPHDRAAGPHDRPQAVELARCRRAPSFRPTQTPGGQSAAA